jgi:hypothetical protein
MNTPDIHDDIDAFYDNLTLEQRQDADIIDRLEFALDLNDCADEMLLEDAQQIIIQLRRERASLKSQVTHLETVIHALTGEPVTYK